MLPKIPKEISDCLAYAAEAREKADSTAHREFRRRYLDVEQHWMNLVDSLRFVESADRFLDDGARNGVSTKTPSPLKADNSHATPIKCERCGGRAHLADCAPCTVTTGARDIWTFKCETCGEELKRVVEK